MAPDEKSTENRLRHQIQDAVEDSLRVWRDDVATLTETPCDRVQAPEGESPNTTDEEGAVHIGAESLGVLTCDPTYIVGDEEEGDAAEDEVRPL